MAGSSMVMHPQGLRSEARASTCPLLATPLYRGAAQDMHFTK